MYQMMMCKKSAAICIALLAFGFVGVPTLALGQSNGFPEVTGTWAGEYQVAFAQSNPQHPDGMETIEMQLDVYR